MNKKVEKWKKWINFICHDCGNVMLSRDMFLNLHSMIEKNPKMQQNDYFHDYMRDTYISHVVMMLRKHAKACNHVENRQNCISLTCLTSEMLDCKNQDISLSLVGDFKNRVDHFMQCAKKVESFADRVVAHRDRRAPSYTPTYNEVNDAIEAMDSLCIQCSLTVGGDYSDTCRPNVKDGWLLIFREMGIET